MKKRWLEYALLLIGLIALDCFVWVKASAGLSQAYEGWSFEQDLSGRPASLRSFVADQWDRLMGRAEVSSPPLAVSVPVAPRPVAPRHQQVLGRLEIPRLDLNVMIREGVDSGTLRKAVGHVPSTALPGQPGNVALAAHRDTYFLPLEHIKEGDRIELQTMQGKYEYVVESMQVVTPRDVWVLKAANHPTLTLVTCFPFHYIGSAPKRFIVRAAEIEAPGTSSPARSSS